MMAMPIRKSGQALTFRVGDERFALGADCVAEVLRRPSLTRVPLAPAGLAGIANLRGAVIPILSVATLIGADEATAASAGSKRIIVVREPSALGLLVDEVTELVPIERVQSGEAAARLLDIDAMLGPDFKAVARAAPGRTVARQQAAAPQRETNRQAFLSFAVAAQEFALPLDSVREVLRLPLDIAIVPHTDDAMLGVMPVRDRLLPLLSLPVLLGLSVTEGAGRRRVVVTSLGGARVGLVVDGVREIIRARPEDIDPVPAVLTRGSQEAQLRSICRVDGGRRLVSILSTDHLLKDGLSDRLASKADERHQMQASVSVDSQQFLIFRVGGESFGMPVTSVDEVVALPSKLSRLPRAPAFVEGVFSLRGRVIPVIDQRQRFAVAAGDTGRSRVLIVRIGETRVGFIVDDVSEVLRISAEQMREAPEFAASGARVIDRIANFESENRLILMIDAQELLDAAERDLLSNFERDQTEA